MSIEFQFYKMKRAEMDGGDGYMNVCNTTELYT
jgi:hypothetical protein